MRRLVSARHGAPSGIPHADPPSGRFNAWLRVLTEGAYRVALHSLTPVPVSEALHCTAHSGAVSGTTVNAAGAERSGAERSGLRVGRSFTAHANPTQYIPIAHPSIAIHPISTRHAQRVGPVRSCPRYTARRSTREQHGRGSRGGRNAFKQRRRNR